MASIDLRSKLGPVEQQGAPNSCVAHAATSLVEAVLGVSDLSRLFVYYNARLIAGQQARDVGCQPRNAVRGLSTYGAPAESEFPYNTAQITVKPPQSAYDAALPLRARIKSYQSVTSLAAMKAAMLSGLPVMFGMAIPDTFVSVTRHTGVQPPMAQTTKWLGNHAMLAVGFDDERGAVLARNSFGPTWGDAGHCWIPYDWFATMSGRVSDAWTIVPV